MFLCLMNTPRCLWRWETHHKYLYLINSKVLFKWIYRDYTSTLIVLWVVILHYHLQCTHFHCRIASAKTTFRKNQARFSHEIAMMCHVNMDIEVAFYNTFIKYVLSNPIVNNTPSTSLISDLQKICWWWTSDLALWICATGCTCLMKIL